MRRSASTQYPLHEGRLAAVRMRGQCWGMTTAAIRSARRRLLFGGRRNLRGDGERADLGCKLGSVETEAGGCPVLGRELDVAVLRPMRQHPDHVTEVCLRVESVETGRGDQGEEVAGGDPVVVASNEQPRLPSRGNPAQFALGGVVLEAQAPVVEEPREGGLLADDVAEGTAQWAPGIAYLGVLDGCPR